MMNYICGVKWNDIHRFKLTNHETDVKVFEINPQEGLEVDYSLSIIPLPASKTLSFRFSSLFYEIIGLFFLRKPFSHIHAVCSVQSSVSEDVDYEVRYDLEQVEGILKKLSITRTVLLTGSWVRLLRDKRWKPDLQL
uniref:Uncharacterized protein n=1 Tax=Knipowitschia caucasica TaxID=637954 RepID=A0AAV2KHA3_KNICA